jgi:predicted DNA-binding protein with PD1-like motif
VNPAGARVFMGTITEGEGVHDALAAAAQAYGVHTATFELLGGLTRLELAAFDFITRTRLPALTFTGALEIVSGHGTIALADAAALADAPAALRVHVHVHITAAFRDPASPTGITVVAGHCAAAAAFAVEYTLTAYDGAPVFRAPHAGTGLALWSLPPVTGEG